MLFFIFGQGLSAFVREEPQVWCRRATDILFVDGIRECPFHSRPAHDKATTARIHIQRMECIPEYENTCIFTFNRK
jgi:hypothetical protein